MMSVSMETTLTSSPLPLPVHFAHAEQSFTLKKKNISSNSTCNSSSPQYYHCWPPRPSAKNCGASVSRVYATQLSHWRPLSRALSESQLPTSLYDPSKQQSFFSQCFTPLDLLGRGSFGEVYKVLSHRDRQQYAVKRSVHRFRSVRERMRCVREVRNHEALGPHPNILDFIGAWEEGDRLYIQTELCCTNLQLYTENQPANIDEETAWAYLCDLLSALQHLHSQGFVHLDVKPANVFLTRSGRLKLGDFGLLIKLHPRGAGPENGCDQEEMQEGDGRYMAPELLGGEYGTAADVFSLGVSILELGCNMEVPKGGEGWQQLRQGCLPTEFTNVLSSELQMVLKIMLAPEPSERASVPQLLSLPSVRRRMWRRQFSLHLQETTLLLASLYQSIMWFSWRLWSSLKLPWLRHLKTPAPCTPPRNSSPASLEDDAEFLQESLDHTGNLSPSFSDRVRSRLTLGNTSTPIPWSPLCTPSPSPDPTPYSTPTHHSHHGSAHSMSGTPVVSSNSAHSRRLSFSGSTRRLRAGEATDTLSWNLSIEPKNLLGMFEETVREDLP